MKHIPWEEIMPFRVGDIIDFDGVLGMLTEYFIWRDGTYGPDWAWRVQPIDPSEYIPSKHYPGDQYGIGDTNMHNIWRSKVVARGPKKQ